MHTGKTIVAARILYHSNSYGYIVLLFAVKYKFYFRQCLFCRQEMAAAKGW